MRNARSIASTERGGKDHEDSSDARRRARPGNVAGQRDRQDCLSLLPITLTLEDYNATEKIGYPQRKLSTTSAPPGVDPSVGDIMHYAPWGNLAIFYKDFASSRGLIGLGRIDSGIGALSVPGSLEVTIEQVGQ